MNNSSRIAMLAVGALAGVWLLWKGADAMYFAPRSELIGEIEDVEGTLRSRQEEMRQRPRIQRQLQEIADRTLGGDLETVDHRLRTRLNRIAEDIALRSITVTTGSPSARQTPARQQFRGAALREFRDEIDFVEVHGEVSAEGTLEQAVALVDRMRAEGWIKRIDRLRIDPQRSGERFNVNVRLTTLFLPGRAPEQPAFSDPDPHRLERYAGLIQANPFRLPPPQEPARIASPPSPSWMQWRVTGLAVGSAGPEVWLRHEPSGRSLRLGMGEQIDGAHFVDVRGEEAEFAIGGDRFLIAIGGKLGDGAAAGE